LEFRHLLVTGGAGFIGSNFVRRLLQARPGLRVTNLDALSYSGNLENLRDVERECGGHCYRFVEGDIGDARLVASLLAATPGGAEPVDAVVHFAAESHVDRSILGPEIFVQTNIAGTTNLLERCRNELAERPRPFRFLHVSTDEVYGSLDADDPAFAEDTPLAPRSPYSASKAGSDLMVAAYAETFGFPAVTTRCSNNYGPYQYPEKLIPLMIVRALAGLSLPVYGDGLNVRDWIHVDDHCDGVLAVLERGRDGCCYNLGGETELRNIDIVRRILSLLDRPETLIEYVTDRPGHDRRYAMNIGRANAELGWAPALEFGAGLERTVAWYVDNRAWWEPLLDASSEVIRRLYAR